MMDAVEIRERTVAESQSRDPRDMGRAELEAYLQNTECFPTKVSLLEFARSHDIPVNGRTHRDEIIRLCLRMLHDIPASFAGLRDAERKSDSPRSSGASTRKSLANFFTGANPGERSGGQDSKKIMSALLDSILNGQDAGSLLVRACRADSEILSQVQEACDGPIETHVRFLDDFLDLLRLETGHRQITSKPLQLRLCLGEVLRNVAPLAYRKGLELCCAVSTEVPEYLIGDTRRLCQIFVNLLENAIDATGQGEVVLEVSKGEEVLQPSIEGEETKTPSILLRFTVRGSGRETAPENSPEPKPVDVSKKGNSQLAAKELRLSLVRWFVELMNGRLEHVSEERQAFSCSFEVQLGVDSTSALEPFLQSLDLRSQALLIVDDNKVQRQILSELLTSWGAEVTLAATGQEALTFFQDQSESFPFAAVMIDGQMEGAEELISILRQQRTENLQTMSPVLLMIPSTLPELEMEKGQGLHGVTFLQKPFTAVEVQQALQEMLVASLALQDGAVFDRQTLWSFVDGDAALLREVIGLFDQDCPRLFFALQTALLGKHGQDVVAGASALKGVVGVFAAGGVLRLLSRIEDLGKQNDLANVQTLLPHLAVGLSSLKLALDVFWQELVSTQAG